MKVFLVFFGLLIVNVSFMVYMGDMSVYVHDQKTLKAVCEECAAGAALILDEDEYAEGRLVFDEDACYGYAEDHIAYALKSTGMAGDDFECSLTFEDDERGYSEGNTERYPSVVCRVSVDTGEIFHTPGLSLTRLERTAKYEVVF